MTTVLLASCFSNRHGEGGVVQLHDDGSVELVDGLPTVGMAVSPDGSRLARVLFGSTDPKSPAHLLVSDAWGVVAYRRLVGLPDPHGLTWDAGRDVLHLVATGPNTVVTLDGAGNELHRCRLPGATDSRHLNCPAVLDGGQVVVSAFGQREDVQGWREPLRAGADEGVVTDVETGETLVRGLRAPHDPLQLADGGWLICNSGRRELLRLAPDGSATARVDLRAWTRGLLLAPERDRVWVGLSTRSHEGEHGIGAVAELAFPSMRETRRWVLPFEEVFALVTAPAALAFGLRAGFAALPGAGV